MGIKSLPEAYFNFTLMSNGKIRLTAGIYSASELESGKSMHEASNVIRSEDLSGELLDYYQAFVVPMMLYYTGMPKEAQAVPKTSAAQLKSMMMPKEAQSVPKTSTESTLHPLLRRKRLLRKGGSRD